MACIVKGNFSAPLNFVFFQAVGDARIRIYRVYNEVLESDSKNKIIEIFPNSL